MVSGADQDQKLFFEANIRPLLSDQCYECHSAQGKIKGGLRLDTRDGLIRGGDSGKVVIPGHPERSLLYEAVTYANVDFQMPPKSRLNADQVSAIAQWISDGAWFPESTGADTDSGESEPVFDIESRLEAHWWKNPVTRPELPGKSAHPSAANAVDLFVGRKLGEAGLKPASQADRRHLVRRMFFDLTGLPPTPGDLETWVTSSRPLSDLADELLDSPRFGEKWAQHWLDLVRYAETLGHEFDYAMPHAWRYRDYLIRAFNADVPYDQLVREHLMGDLMDEPRRRPDINTNESIIGTAFYWLGQQVHSPVDLLGNQAEVTDNQIDVMTKTFLGLTVSCARCHDHKFDAISTRDYYSLFGSLTSSRYHQAVIDPPELRQDAISRLKIIRSEIRSAISAEIPETVKSLENEVLALVELFSQTGPLAGDDKGNSASKLFEDFESGQFSSEKWRVEGDAFGIRPLKVSELAGYQGEVGAVGQYLVNSHNSVNSGDGVASSDSPRGSLTSVPLTVDFRYLHFLIGGGAHDKKTGLQILVDGKVEHHEKGPQSNRMRPAVIDMSRWAGKIVQLRILDDHSDGWGNVGIDHIVFSNIPVHFDNSDNQPLGITGDLAAVSQKFGVSVDRLAQLAALIPQGKNKDEGHPLRLLADRVNGYEASGGKGEAPELPHWPGLSDESGILLTSDRLERDGWQLLEEAFDDAAVKPGDLIFDQGSISLAEYPGIHSGRLDPRLEGTASGPTFVIEKPYLHVLCSGKDSRINVVMENFNMIRGPIYDGIKKKPNWNSPRWLTFDLSMWIGRDAYLQINDFPVSDLAGPGSGTESTGAIYASCQSDNRRMSDLKAGKPDGDFIALTRSALESFTIGEQILPSQAAWINALTESRVINLASGEKLEALMAAKKRVADSMPAPERVPAMVEGFGKNELIAIRGNPRNRGGEAGRGYMEAFHDFAPDQSAGVGSGRREFTEWVLSPENPLTARVYVNRVWQHLFGEGLVTSVDDMGLMGQEPTHPELLDWLAHWFTHEGEWSTRSLVRLLVNSYTYQMSAEPAGSKWMDVDPANTLLHSARIRRLPAELIRDNLLAVSGALTDHQSGPSIPVHLTSFMEGRGRPRNSGPLDGDGRRSVYLEIRRNFLVPMLLAFDKPIPFTSVGRRTRSNVPAQALIMMNDPFVQQQAGVMAGRLIREAGSSIDERIRLAYILAFGRSPNPDELDQSREFLVAQAGVYGVQVGDASPLADLCHTLFNLKEFIFIQ